MADKEPRKNKSVLADGFLTIWEEKKHDAMQMVIKAIPEPVLRSLNHVCLGNPKLMMGGLSMVIKHYTNLSDFGDDLVDGITTEIAQYLCENYGKDSDGKSASAAGKKFDRKPGITIFRVLPGDPNRTGFMERLNRFLGAKEVRMNQLLDYSGEKSEISEWIKILSQCDDEYIYNFYVKLLIGPSEEPVKSKPVVWEEILKYKKLFERVTKLEAKDKTKGTNKVKALLEHLGMLPADKLDEVLKIFNRDDTEDTFKKEVEIIYDKSHEKILALPKVAWKWGEEFRKKEQTKTPANFLSSLAKSFKQGERLAD